MGLARRFVTGNVVFGQSCLARSQLAWFLRPRASKPVSPFWARFGSLLSAFQVGQVWSASFARFCALMVTGFAGLSHLASRV